MPLTPEIIEAKRRKRMAAIDALPVDVRALVHEYGFNVVKTLLDLGVTKPKHIRHVVETVLDEFSPTRGAFSRQGIRTEVHQRQPLPTGT